MKSILENRMDEKIKLNQSFETLDDRIDFRSLYSKCRLEILASEIKQTNKKKIKFNIKNKVANNFLY